MHTHLLQISKWHGYSQDSCYSAFTWFYQNELIASEIISLLLQNKAARMVKLTS